MHALIVILAIVGGLVLMAAFPLVLFALLTRDGQNPFQ